MDNNKMTRTDHKQVKAKAPDGTKIEVDEGMRKLLEMLWKLGIETIYSCQGDPFFIDQYHYEAKHFRAYIQMKNNEEALGFLTDIFACTDVLDAKKASFTIDFDHHPKTGAQRICIRFPHADIKVLYRLAKFIYEAR